MMFFDFSTVRRLIIPVTLLACSVAANCSFAQLQHPIAVASAANGDVYIADRALPGIWKWDGSELTKYFEASRKFGSPLNAVRSLAFDSEGALLVGDSGSREVFRFDAEGKPQPLTDKGVGIAMGLATLSTGDIVASDPELGVIWKIPKSGGPPTQLAKLPAPRGIAVGNGDTVWVISQSANQLQKVSPEGTVTVVVQGRPFRYTADVAIDETGIAYISDSYAKAIWKVKNGKPEKWVEGEPLMHPVGLALRKDADGSTQILVADSKAKQVFVIASEGSIAPLK